MRILLVCDSFPPSKSEAGVAAFQIGQLLVKRGHSVRVLTAEKQPKSHDEMIVTGDPSKLEIKTQIKWSDGVISIGFNYQLIKPLIFSLRKPHILVLQNLLPRKWELLFFKFRLLRSDGIYIANNYLAKNYNWEEDTRTIRNGYDTKLFHTEDTGFRNFDFVFSGELNEKSGVDLVVHAMHQLSPDLKCVIVGDGPLRKSLEAIKSTNTEFIGALDEKYEAEIFRQTKWLILPSRSRMGSGMKGIQAIACGARVIAANHGGLPEAIGPCGLLFKPGTLESLHINMRKAMERDDFIGFTEAERLNHLENYSFEKQTDQLLVHLQSI